MTRQSKMGMTELSNSSTKCDYPAQGPSGATPAYIQQAAMEVPTDLSGHEDEKKWA